MTAASDLKMALGRITQETFDAAVKENIDEFDMDPDEALREAEEQFRSQGVDLSCIVKAAPSRGEQAHEILEALESLRLAQDRPDGRKAAATAVARFSQQCSLGLAQRYLAAQKGAYALVLSYCQRSAGDREAALAAASALAALTDGQPDLLDEVGGRFLLDLLAEYRADPEVTRAAISAVRHSCLKHERNRQELVKGGVLPFLTDAIRRHGLRAEVLKEACGALRVMTFDDDVRVPFGHAHEHAKMIILQHYGLKVLIESAQGHKDNMCVLSELCATLSRLAVRNEFCQDICDLGGLQLMMTLLADGYESPDLLRQVLSAVRAVAGNDDVKDAVVKAAGVHLIVGAVNRHMTVSAVCEQGCACLSVLALRKPNNCKVIMEEGGALAAVQAMKTHPAAVNVQKQACMLLRNLVSHQPDYSRALLELGAEALILQALRSHGDCGDAAKAALRDLGCQVDLRELWTGKHGAIPN